MSWLWPRQRINDGAEYERYVAGLLEKRGWTVEHVGGAGDQGVDLIATMRRRRVAVQCKWRMNAHASVGNNGVQEVYAGREMHNCAAGVVITNGWFTRGARKAADATGVILLRDDAVKTLRRLVGVRRLWRWEAWALAVGAVMMVADLGWVTRPAWTKTGHEQRFEPRVVVPRRVDTTAVGGPSPITPPRGIRVGLPEGSMVLRCVRWGEAEHAREEKAKEPMRGYNHLFQMCMNNGALVDAYERHPENDSEQLLVEKAVRPPRRCDEMNDRRCKGE